MLTLTFKTITRTLLGFLMAAAAMSVFADSPNNRKMVATGPDNVAIKGYDTVAYFTEAQPTKGQPEFAYSWNDARWYFANAAHRDLFAANPERYAPRFGGRCSMGLSKGKKVAANPEVWTIVDGKLYLYFSEAARDKFRQSSHENIEKARTNWDKVKK